METVGSLTESEDDMTFLILMCMYAARKRKAKRRAYLRKRATHGAFALTRELADERFSNFVHMSREEFQEVLGMVAPAITAVGCNWQKPVPADEKLAVFLRYLATGDTFKSLGYSFRRGDRTISNIVNELSDVIWKAMQPSYLSQPNTEDWRSIATDFETRWQFPHCVGALGGKHVTIKKPRKSGSPYFTYKHTFSVVLLAAVDAKYKFTFVDIGSQGRFSDGSIFSSSELGKKLADGTLDLPTPEVLPSFKDPLPFVFVGDGTFPLMVNLMRPYPKRYVTEIQPNKIFNYRLSRARQTVECAFGILASRFRVFQKPFEIKASSVVKIIKAACVLHNYLRRNAEVHGESESTEAYTDQAPTRQLLPISATKTRSTKEAYYCRNKYAEYFNTMGSVSWQEDSVSQGHY